jgi:hypothetical protein
MNLKKCPTVRIIGILSATLGNESVFCITNLPKDRSWREEKIRRGRREEKRSRGG